MKGNEGKGKIIPEGRDGGNKERKKGGEKESKKSKEIPQGV